MAETSEISSFTESGDTEGSMMKTSLETYAKYIFDINGPLGMQMIFMEKLSACSLPVGCIPLTVIESAVIDGRDKDLG